ncbi:MAG: hypothetical protein ABSF67_17730 [Roseiarcus sp.]
MSMVDYDRINELRKTYLCYLLEYTRVRDPHLNVFRTFVDNWFAYYMGDPFLKSSLVARWFNKGDLNKKSEAITKFHIHSVRAWQVINGLAEPEDLIKDHCIPLSVIRGRLFDVSPTTIGELETFLIEHYKIGLITQKENAELNSLKLQSTLPPGVPYTPEARYQHAKIALHASESEPVEPMRLG